MEAEQQGDRISDPVRGEQQLFFRKDDYRKGKYERDPDHHEIDQKGKDLLRPDPDVQDGRRKELLLRMEQSIEPEGHEINSKVRLWSDAMRDSNT